MARKSLKKNHQVKPDFIYQSPLVARIINYAMKNGNKKASEKQVYKALNLLKKNHEKEDVALILEQALENIRPKTEVRPRRIGGAVYQVPTPVRSHRQNSLAIRWLINSTRQKANKQFHTFAEKLTDEITLALKNEGPSVAKRIEVERMAEANKAFAHLRW